MLQTGNKAKGMPEIQYVTCHENAFPIGSTPYGWTLQIWASPKLND